MVFEKFTERSQLILVEAQKESQHFNHGYIGTEHILLGILKENGFSKEILTKNSIRIDIVKKSIEDYLGYGDIQVSIGEMLINPRTKRIFEDSLVKARIYNHNLINPEHILLSLLDDTDGVAYYLLKSLKLNFDLVKDELKIYLKESNFEKDKVEEKNKKIKKTPMLDQYGTNMTDLAKEGKLDPVIGRDEENQRILEILCRRIKNNPCLIGEPGVGKTAVIEGLAQRIVNGNVPEILKNKIIISLDLTSMVAGAKYRGEFEDRLKKAMEEIKASEDIIIFIDEIHTIVGAGGAEGAIDASNILKPSLARGEIKCIGATTIKEYRKYIEKDAALERRFQPVSIEEPSKEESLEILKGIRVKYEEHHNVKILDEALEAAVELADRYITDRFMPDKAIDLIDEASAKVRIENLNKPIIVDSFNLDIKLQQIIDEKEVYIKNQNFEKAAFLREEEIKVKEEILNNKKDIEEFSLDRNQVNKEQIARVVSLWTKVPLEKLTEAESEKLLKLEDILSNKVIGQKEAILAISKAIRRSRVGLKDPNRPIGTFIFCGPTGVGKTELCNVLAEAMFGKRSNLVRVDMSEYMEKHSVSRLIGAPPGYIGYSEGGQLTEAVRRNPYSVILFDEIEKAHEDIFNILLQVMEDGRLTDSMGRVINFKNTIIIMTSNVGAHAIKKQNSMGFSTNEEMINDNEYNKMKNSIMESIKKQFKPEFLNRIDDTIVFHKLKEDDILQIVNIMLKSTVNKLKERKINLVLDEESKKFIVNKGVDVNYGARPLRRIIMSELEDKLSEEMLKGFIKVGDNLEVYCDGKELNFKHIS